MTDYYFAWPALQSKQNRRPGEDPWTPLEAKVEYQFAHLSTFSRRGNRIPMKHKKGRVSEGGRSVRDIYFEAAREAGHATHVENPQPPNIIFNALGMPLVSHVDEIEKRIAVRNLTLKQQKLKTIRMDTHVLEGMVFSHPFYTRSAPDNHNGDPRKCLSQPDALELYQGWRTDTIAWAKNNANLRGMSVLAIIEHLDESHPHIHVISLPNSDMRMNAKSTHPGYQAKSAAIDNGELPKIASKKYRDAMREWQDDYHVNVGIRHGLTRYGPKRQRLTRQEWRIKKAEADRSALNMKLIHDLRASSVKTGADALNRKNYAEKMALSLENEIAITKSLRLELNGKIEALDAWAKGHIEFNSKGNADIHEKMFRDEGGADRKRRIISQSAWIYSELTNLDRRVKEHIRKIVDDEVSKTVEHVKSDVQDAFIIAAQAWARGVLLGKNENANDGKHHFDFGNTGQNEVAEIEAKLQNFGKEIAEFLESLPDRNEIAEVERLAKELGPSLSKEMSARTASLRMKLGGLWQGRQGQPKS